MPREVALVDLLRMKNSQLTPPQRVFLSGKTLLDIQNSYRDWEIRDAQKRDKGIEKDLIKMHDGNFSSWEARQTDIHKKTPYAQTGDLIYGMQITTDDGVPYGTFRFE